MTVDSTSAYDARNHVGISPQVQAKLDAVDIANNTNASTSKTTPADADELPLVDSASNGLKKLTWANVKANLKTYFDSLYRIIPWSNKGISIKEAGSTNETAIRGLNIADVEVWSIGGYNPLQIKSLAGGVEFRDYAGNLIAPVHVHGNISDGGAIGSTPNLPLITGASGVIQVGSFGTTVNTFCQGNDARLSDARTPTAHNHSASEIVSGELAKARQHAQTAYKDSVNTYSQTQTFDADIVMNSQRRIVSASPNASESNARFGTIEIQSYDINNAWIGENVFFGGAGWQRRQTGKAALFYFIGDEGQFRCFPSGAAGSDPGGNVQWKIMSNGTMAVGASIGNTAGNLSGAAFLVDGAGNVTANGSVSVGPITKSALLALTPSASAGEYRITNSTPVQRRAYPDGTNWRYSDDSTIVT